MKTAWNTNANTLQKTMNLNKITHLGRAVLRFCSSAYPRSTWYILKKPCVFSQYVKNMWWRRHWISQTVQRSCGRSDLYMFLGGEDIYIYIFWTNNQHFEGLEHAAEVILDFSRPIQIFETCGRSICHAVFAFAFGSLTFPCRPCHLTEGWIRPGKLTTVTVAKLTGCLGGQMIAAAVGQRSRSVIEWYI